MFLMWFDDTKKPTARKIDEAVATYIERFNVKPNVALVNADDATPMEGITVRTAKNIQKHNFWIGIELSQ